MRFAHGQALVEQVCVLAMVVAALCLPLFGGPPVIVQLEDALRLFWRSWSESLLSLAVAVAT